MNSDLLLPIVLLIVSLTFNRETSANENESVASGNGSESTNDTSSSLSGGGKFCEVGILLPLTKNRKLNTFYIPWSPRSSRCQWTIAGLGDCEVELSCSVDIPDTAKDNEDDMTDCQEEFLKISDGSTGFMKFCGKKFISKIRANEGLKDLFVHISTSSKAMNWSEEEHYGRKRFRGIYCHAQCGTPKAAGIIRLPQNFRKRIDNQCICGLQGEGENSRIVGGEDSYLNEFPWQAAVVEADTRFPECGASVINNRFILSAAHCFVYTDREPEDIQVLVHAFVLDQLKEKRAKDVEFGKQYSIRSAGYNATTRTDADEKTQRFNVVRIINHPLFDKLYDFDYALLELETPIIINGQTTVDAKGTVTKGFATPVCLPPAKNSWEDQLAEWKRTNFSYNLTVSGWGKALQNAGGSTRILQKLQVPYIPFATCNEWIPNRLTERMICAGYENGTKDSCVGDSGGPLTYKMPNSQFRQVGIVSWGVGCAKAKKPGLYSRIRDAMQWIDFHTQRRRTEWCRETI